MPKIITEIFDQIIPHYQQAIDELPEEKKMLRYLLDKRMSSGICFYASITLKKEDSIAIVSHFNLNLTRAFITPKVSAFENSRVVVIEALQARLDYMEDYVAANPLSTGEGQGEGPHSTICTKTEN